MNDRLIPVVVLLLDFLFPLVVVQFLPSVSSILLVAAWSFVSLFCLILVAYWVYEDGKRIDTIEERLLRRVDKLEDLMKITSSVSEELEERIEKLEKRNA